jgi:hypothetical protein
VPRAETAAEMCASFAGCMTRALTSEVIEAQLDD